MFDHTTIVILTFALAVIVVASGCAESRPPQATVTPVNRSQPANHVETITRALDAMLTRTNDDAFVIVEEKSTGKFVQFAGSATDPLLLDLPTQTLSVGEHGRAQTLFTSMGGPGREEWGVTNMNGVSAGTQASFQLEFGRATDKAAAAGIRVLREVYGFPAGAELVLTEN